jgi:23S rRNA pseudouridine1911/1915/1917 synthase
MEDDEALAWPSPELPVLFQGQVVPYQTLAKQIDAANHGKRLDVVLSQFTPEFSRNHIQSLIERGVVRVGGQVVTQPSKKVTAGQLIDAVLEPTAQTRAFTPEPMDIPVVYEDEHLLVVNKPAGWVVHPAAGNWSGTLLNGLLAHHAASAQLPRAGIVHRLDKDTSGLMVVGKTLVAVTALSRSIAAREVHRQYLALVWGQPPAQLTIDAPVGRDPVTRIKMAVLPSGKPAKTDITTLASVQIAQAEGSASRVVSAVRCVLHTGRTHQIRVHLSSRKWPLLADKLYGGQPALGLARQALHAEQLSFAHPVTAQPLSFEAPLPLDMAQALAQVLVTTPSS